MGVIRDILGLGGAVREVAEVFVENRTKTAANEHAENIATLEQLTAEFARERGGWFDQLVDGLNRLPRPALAMGTLALFAYAMADPVGFAARMQGLQLVPDPLWWLLGAIVSFYFGARELHHFRSGRGRITPSAVADVARTVEQLEAMDQPVETQANPALAAWRAQAG